MNLTYPKSNNHRGRVGQGISNTLTTSGNMGVVVAALEYRKDKWYEVTGIVLDGKLYRLGIRRLIPENALGFKDFLIGLMSEQKLYQAKANYTNKQAIA